MIHFYVSSLFRYHSRFTFFSRLTSTAKIHPKTHTHENEDTPPNSFAPNSKLILPIFLNFHDNPRSHVIISLATFFTTGRHTHGQKKLKEKKIRLYVSMKRRPPHAARQTKWDKNQMTRILCTNVHVLQSQHDINKQKRKKLVRRKATLKNRSKVFEK